MASLGGAGVLSGIGRGLNQGVQNYFRMKEMQKNREASDHKQRQADQRHAITMGNLRAMGNIGADSLRPGAGSTVKDPGLGVDPDAAGQGSGVMTEAPGVESLALPGGQAGKDDLQGGNEAISNEELERMAYQAAISIRERKRVLKTMRDLAPKAERLYRSAEKVRGRIDKMAQMMDEFKEFPADPEQWKTLKGKYENLSPEDAMSKRAEVIKSYKEDIAKYEDIMKEANPIRSMVRKYGVPREALQSSAHLIEWLNKQEARLNALGANYK